MVSDQDLLAWALPHIEQSDGWFDIYASGFQTAARIAFGRGAGEAERIIERMRAEIVDISPRHQLH